METTLRRIGDTLGALSDALSRALAEGAWRPELWPPVMWVWLGALFLLLALAALRRARPRPLEVRPPQLLITKGEVVPDTLPEATPRRRRRGGDPGDSRAGTLTMTVSNLSRYPVQLLEVALREETRGAPRVTEVEAVVPGMGAVDVVLRVPLGLRGDGWIDLYCYAAAPRHKLHRHRAELVWEPWASRFKVAPMEQVAAPVRRLASDERQARFEVEPAPGVEASAASGTAAGAPVAPPVRAAPLPAERRGTDAPTPSATPPRSAGPGERRIAVSRAAPAPTAPDGGSSDATERSAAPRLGALWDRLPRTAGRPSARLADLPIAAPDEVAPEPAEPVRVVPSPLPDDADAAASAPERSALDPAGDPVGVAASPPPEPPASSARVRPRLEFPDEF